MVEASLRKGRQEDKGAYLTDSNLSYVHFSLKNSRDAKGEGGRIRGMALTLRDGLQGMEVPTTLQNKKEEIIRYVKPKKIKIALTMFNNTLLNQ